jgi:hypothetical protein
MDALCSTRSKGLDDDYDYDDDDVVVVVVVVPVKLFTKNCRHRRLAPK